MTKKLSEHLHFVCGPETRELIDRGAAANDETRSELIRRGSRREAVQVLAAARWDDEYQDDE